jgi:ferredoxin
MDCSPHLERRASFHKRSAYGSERLQLSISFDAGVVEFHLAGVGGASCWCLRSPCLWAAADSAVGSFQQSRCHACQGCLVVCLEAAVRFRHDDMGG